MLHGSAATMQSIRAVIPRSKALPKKLATQHCPTQKIVAKWRKSRTGFAGGGFI